jgi:mannitol operon repressor
MIDDGRKVVHAVGHSSKITPYLQPFADFLGDLNAESDRGAVLTAAAFIDDLLGKTIAAFLVEGARAAELFEEYPGPLSNFSARILPAHALGLISNDERTECSAIRKVRNEFAHAAKMSFDNERVKSLCGSLKAGQAGGQKPNARMQFTTSAVAVIANLYNRPHYVSKARLKFVNWKV